MYRLKLGDGNDCANDGDAAVTATVCAVLKIKLRLQEYNIIVFKRPKICWEKLMIGYN